MTMSKNEFDRLIKSANEVITDYYQHRSSTINLWATYAPFGETYVICVENAIAPGTGISSIECLQISGQKYTYKDFIKIIDKLHSKWPNTPILFHDLSKKRLNELRDKYGNYIIRDDIVISKE